MDGQTDGRTDRILITIRRLHYMLRGNNGTQRHNVIAAILLVLLYLQEERDRINLAKKVKNYSE